MSFQGMQSNGGIFMDIAALKYFIVVAQLEHMNRAAQMLNITQPSLSMSIKRLEAELGYQLFERSGHRIKLNEYGRIFLEASNNILETMQSASAKMESLYQSSSAFLKLCCSGSPTNTRLIEHLLQQGIRFQVSNIPSQWENDLLHRNCDLVITMGRMHSAGIACKELLSQDLVFVCDKQHPLARVGTITQTELELYSFCSTDAPHSLINVVRETMPELRFRPRIAFLGRSSGDMVKAIHSGMHIGLMVRRNLPNDDNLVILDVDGFSPSLPIFMYWREKDPRTSAMLALQQNIADYYRMLPVSE